MKQRVVLHCDMNSFFASVEIREHPEWKDCPMAVCGSTEERHGIVLAKNEIAKAMGVSTGEAIWQAKRKCPSLLTVEPHYEKYLQISQAARQLYEGYTDRVEAFGIDECWLDVTGSTRLFGTGRKIANEIRHKIRYELGITASVGVSFNKIFAKLGSDLKKPDAVTEILPHTFRDVVWPQQANMLFGVGRVGSRRLADCGIHTIGDLACAPPAFLESRLGKCGRTVWEYANGLDCSEVASARDAAPIQSIGHGTTPPRDLRSGEEVWPLMLFLTQEIGHKLRLHECNATGVVVGIRDETLHSREWQTSLTQPTQSALELAHAAYALLQSKYPWDRPLHSVTVTAIRLRPQKEAFQIDLFTDAVKSAKWNRAEETMEAIRMRYGERAITSAVLLQRGGVLSGKADLAARGFRY